MEYNKNGSSLRQTMKILHQRRQLQCTSQKTMTPTTTCKVQKASQIRDFRDALKGGPVLLSNNQAGQQGVGLMRSPDPELSRQSRREPFLEFASVKSDNAENP